MGLELKVGFLAWLAVAERCLLQLDVCLRVQFSIRKTGLLDSPEARALAFWASFSFSAEREVRLADYVGVGE